MSFLSLNFIPGRPFQYPKWYKRQLFRKGNHCFLPLAGLRVGAKMMVPALEPELQGHRRGCRKLRQRSPCSCSVTPTTDEDISHHTGPCAYKGSQHPWETSAAPITQQAGMKPATHHDSPYATFPLPALHTAAHGQQQILLHGMQKARNTDSVSPVTSHQTN